VGLQPLMISDVNMHPIAERFFALNDEQKRLVHISMASIALTSWRRHVSSESVPLKYQETVAGTFQVVDVELPAEALEAVISGVRSNIAKRYLEPICAMQDDDWEFNDDAEMAYYAIYNTYRKYIEGKEIDNWLIVNQSLSSLGKDADIMSPLKLAVDSAEKSENKKNT